MTRLRRARPIAVVIAALGVFVGLAYLASTGLPSGTSTSALATRALIALAIGGLLVAFVRRMMRALTEPPPPPLPTVDATTADVVYECTVCGTRLRLEVASTGKAPKHCGEEMESRLAP